MSQELPSHARAAILSLLEEDRLIEAIKLYREHTNAGLKESKEAVEFIRDNPGTALHDSPAEHPPEASRFGLDPADFQSDQEDKMADVIRHIKAGRKIHAIKAYRLVTNDGLKEAKEAVEKMARNVLEHDPEVHQKFEKSGDGTVFIFLVVGAVILLSLLILLRS